MTSDQVLATFKDFPKIPEKLPFWSVAFRPATYDPNRIQSLSDCTKLVEKAKVRLRGWDFPHLPNRNDECQGMLNGSTWIGSWVNFMGEIERWKMHQSGQYVYLGIVRETVEGDWQKKLEQETKSHLRHVQIDWSAVPGYVSLVNLVYSFTEYFEFAARIAQAGYYTGEVDISIGLFGGKGLLLTTDMNRFWRNHCPAGSNELEKTWRIASNDLVAGASEHSQKAIVWICECFGWMNPNTEAIQADQKKLISGKL